MDNDKRAQELSARLAYIEDIFGGSENTSISLLRSKLGDFRDASVHMSEDAVDSELQKLEELFDFLEYKLDGELSPMDRVRIVRHPQRICLHDILENVYDNYTEIGGQDECSIDPSLCIARATFTRRAGKRVVNQMVMVIGQETGHGEAFRNGGSVSPWGNAKALHYMKVAETENIPIHTYVFTPGAYPVEENPGAAQQIARNLFEMAALSVPVVSVFSEGGSGGAEAIALSDVRLMLSHGYYSAISPEGAAAIEGGLRKGSATPENVEKCARQLRITAEDNLRQGYVDRIIREPALGARPEHFDFFRDLRREVILATNETVASVKGIQLFRALALRGRRGLSPEELENIFVRWELSHGARKKLLERRWLKFRAMSRHAYVDTRGPVRRAMSRGKGLMWAVSSFIRHDLLGRHRRRLRRIAEEVGAEALAVRNGVRKVAGKVFGAVPLGGRGQEDVEQALVCLSRPEEGIGKQEGKWRWNSPRHREDREVSCPHAEKRGCPSMWAPDLFGDFAGVCTNCGHHFPMEYQWYLRNIFDYSPSREFATGIQAGNPLRFEGLELKLERAREHTGLKSSCLTFETEVDGVQCVVVCLAAPFRGGTVGAAEGEKFVLACERAMYKRLPLVAYVHGTAGIRIQEGVNGVIQMPRLTMAVRRYLDAGGLYVVIYDTNSYAGPVASFLGCSPYQFAIRSSRIGFAGPAVIRETTGVDVPPNYHSAHNALARGHILDIWDRRHLRHELSRALLTMGGRNLYYR